MDLLKKILKSVWESKTKFDLVESFKDLDKVKALIIKDIIEENLRRVVVSLVGERYQREMPALEHTGCFCVKCGAEVLPDEMNRNGSRKKQLIVRSDTIELHIPRLKHKGCGGEIDIPFGIIEKYQRKFADIQAMQLQDYMEGIGHRGCSRTLSHLLNSGVSAMSSWKNIQYLGGLIKEDKSPLPKKLQLVGDEISIRLRTTKKKGTNKHEIYGLLLHELRPQGTPLAFGITDRRTAEDWKVIFENMKSRGLETITLLVRDGAKAIEEAARSVLGVEHVQQCVFHTKKSIIDDLKRAKNKGEITKRYYKKIRSLVKEIFDLTDKEKIQKKILELNSYSFKYAEKLEANFATIFNYLDRDSQLNKTSNLVERGIKDFRRRFKIMESFKTMDGAINFGYLWQRKEKYRREKKDWLNEVLSEIKLDNMANRLERIYGFLKKPIQEAMPVLDYSIFDKRTVSVPAMATGSLTGECLRRISHGKSICQNLW